MRFTHVTKGNLLYLKLTASTKYLHSNARLVFELITGTTAQPNWPYSFATAAPTKYH